MRMAGQLREQHGCCENEVMMYATKCAAVAG